MRADAPSVHDEELIFAVGDIHGRADLLAALLSQIAEDADRYAAAQRTLVFLGDYVDRGPDSRGVIDTLLSGLPSGFATCFLKGNHEAMLLGFLDNADRLDHWRMNGGEATMRSYGVDVDRLTNDGAAPEVWCEAFARRLPPAHWNFLTSLQLQYSAGGYLFVHAGVRPGVPLNAQTETDLIWIREPFLSTPRTFGKVVVHGHTPSQEPTVRHNRIGIDTGAVFTGRLTALRLQNADAGFLQAED